MEKNKYSKSKSNFTLIYLFAFITLIIFSSFFYFTFKNPSVSGRAVYKLETNFSEGELDGKFFIYLREGELLPYDSELIFEYGEEEKRFFVYDLINEELSEGNYYLSGKQLSGQGQGYGLEGTKIIAPEVEFVLKISKSESSDTPDDEDNVGEEIDEETVEELEEILDEEIGEQVEEESNDALEEEIELSVITGNIISRRITGLATFGIEKEITGFVDYNNPFIYQLSEGETAEIVSSSEEVNLVIEGGVLTITTEFIATENGFGLDYLGDGEYQIVILLSELSLNPQEGELTVSLEYQGTEIITISALLDYENPFSEIPIEEIEEIKNISDLNLGDISDYELTNSEKFLLTAEIGTYEPKITKSELINNRLIIRFEAGKYWRENSYPYPLNNLEYLIELDRARFIKYLAKNLDKATPSISKIEAYFD